jgi:hypothetical protein
MTTKPRSMIKAASASFRERLNDGGLKPSTFLLDRMRDENTPMPERVVIADKLVQYELPRLAAIEAEVTDTRKTHEDWIKELSEDETRDEEHTIQ